MTSSDYKVENCPNCGNIFRKTNWPLCQSCQNEVENDLSKCAKVTRKNGKTTVAELSQQTGVAEVKIMKYIRDSKLFIGDLPNMFYACELCGANIRKGTLCLKCRTKINTDIEKMNSDELKQIEKERLEKKAAYRINDRLNKQ